SQQVPLEGAVTAGDVGEAGAQRHGSVDVAATGEELAVGRPVHGLAALNVAGTQDELRAIVDLVQQQVELLRGVGAVGVHLAENLITVLDAPLETGQVGPTEAALTFAVQHVDAGVVFGHLIRQLPGTVRRVVVDNEEIDTLRLGFLQATRHDRKVIALVESRDDDESLIAYLLHNVISFSAFLARCGPRREEGPD